ncbi:MAG TPA: hypothetical protein VGT41_05630 [Candidatus Babeliales bacterium]|nr:hypothetical protein [Candidatus Babeliales bacterium]
MQKITHIYGIGLIILLFCNPVVAKSSFKTTKGCSSAKSMMKMLKSYLNHNGIDTPPGMASGADSYKQSGVMKHGSVDDCSTDDFDNENECDLDGEHECDLDLDDDGDDECCDDDEEMSDVDKVLSNQCDMYEVLIKILAKVCMLETKVEQVAQEVEQVAQVCEDSCDAINRNASCEILVSEPCGHYFHLTDLPAEGQAVIWQFDSCFGPCGNIPRLIFDPAVYGNNGIIELQPHSRIIFRGEGIVELRNGVHFVPLGTPYCPFDRPACASSSNCPFDTSVNPGLDWPTIVVEEGAIMTLSHCSDPNATQTVLIGGPRSVPIPHPVTGLPTFGCGLIFIVRQEGQVLLDHPSQLIFGGTVEDDFSINIKHNSELTARYAGTNDLSDNVFASQSAIITFQLACFDFFFDHYAALNVYPGGIVEMNMARGSAFTNAFPHNPTFPITDTSQFVPEGLPAEGVVRKLYFDEGSLIQILRRGLEVGLLRVAPNFNPGDITVQNGLGSDLPVDFNNRSGNVVGGGFIQFKEFVLDPIVPSDALDVLRALPYQQGGVILAGSILPTPLAIPSRTLVDRFELTADTFLPAGTIILAGSFVSGIATPFDIVVPVGGQVYPRGTILARGSFLAAQTIPAGTLTAAYILAERIHPEVATPTQRETVLPLGTTLEVGSELVNTVLRFQDNQFEQIRPFVQTFNSMGYITNIVTTSVDVADANKFVKKGSLIPEEDGRLAIICPPIRDQINRDGSIVGLDQNDTDAYYNSFRQVGIFNKAANQIKIDNGEEATKTVNV